MPARKHTAPGFMVPQNAADCHLHVFGPFERFPLSRERAYNVDEAPLAEHEAVKRQAGLERSVLVQASGYGTDNRCMLSALAQLGARGRAIAVIDPGMPQADLQALHLAGVRGARLNLHTLSGRYAGDTATLIERFAHALAPLGWHLQLFIDADTVAALEPVLARLPIVIVFDHMGLPDARQGVAQPGFQAVLRLARAGRTWVKLAGADRVTQHSGRTRDAIAFMRALVDAAPDRLVWGSDWPNIGFHSRRPVEDGAVLAYRAIDAGEMLDILAEAVPDAGTRHAILVRNPAALYGFD